MNCEAVSNNVNKLPEMPLAFKVAKADDAHDNDDVTIIDFTKSKTSEYANNVADFYGLSFAQKYIPETGVTFIANKAWANNLTLEEELKRLPKLPNGDYDTDKIKKSLQIAQKEIFKKNTKAKKLISYGMHRKNINGFNPLLLQHSPIVVHTLEKLGLLKEKRVETFGMVNKFISWTLDKFGNKKYSCELKSINNELNPKSSFAIEDAIKKQNEEMERLLKLPLNNTQDIVHFLNEYKKILGTSFVCENINYAAYLSDNDEVTHEEKIKEYIKAFGLPENYIDAQKNNMMTNILYSTGLKYVLPKMLMKVPTGVAWAPFVPMVIEAEETVTQGTKENQIINPQKVNSKDATRVLYNGFIYAGLTVAPPLTFFERCGVKSVTLLGNSCLSGN